MTQTQSFVRRFGLFSLSVALLLGSAPFSLAHAEDEPTFPSSEDPAATGAELPPPPVQGTLETPPADLTAEALPPPPADAVDLETPPGEELPALPMDGDPKDQANQDVPAATEFSDVPPPPIPDSRMGSGPSQFSSSQELGDLSMEDRLKSKELVLWLSLGPSFGSLSSKGANYVLPSGAGGLGYNVGIGGMVSDAFLLQFDFTGTPRTVDSTVDQAMFAFGPRLGFLTLMGTFGVQQAPTVSPTDTNGTVTYTDTGGRQNIFMIGARAGLDLVLKHSKDSRVSIGLAPEAFIITPQGNLGYTSAGVSVSLRIYGYDQAF